MKKPATRLAVTNNNDVVTTAFAGFRLKRITTGRRSGSSPLAYEHNRAPGSTPGPPPSTSTARISSQMSINVISGEVRKARQARPCTWCGQPIEVGQNYRHERLTVDGHFRVNDLHPECDEALAEACQAEGGQVYFDPGQNDRPALSGA